MGKVRRQFDAQFKNRVCEMIRSSGQTITDVCRDYQLARSVVSRWLEQSNNGPLPGKPSVRERELERENEKLKAKVGELTMLVDVLKKVDAWKRQQRSVASSVVTTSNLAQFQRPAESLDLPSPATTTGRKATRR